jgi:hypothetical protein
MPLAIRGRAARAIAPKYAGLVITHHPSKRPPTSNATPNTKPHPATPDYHDASKEEALRQQQISICFAAHSSIPKVD